MMNFPVRIRLPDGWTVSTIVAAALVAVPIAAVLSASLKPSGEIMRHLASTMLARLVFNTIVLTGGVAILTSILGVSLAWLTAVCDFPGRRSLSWLLLLPMAVPAYVMAFTFLGLMDFSGPLYRVLTTAGLPAPSDPRSVWGVILVMSLSLYPYVYLLSRSAFLSMGIRGMEAARSLGVSPLRAFFSVALPMARPWIAGGVILVIMEVLADFGAVSIFNYDTFTTAIYKAWFGFFSLSAAAKLSGILVVFALSGLLVEQKMRSKMRFTTMGRDQSDSDRFTLVGAARFAALFYTGTVLTVAFLIPVGQLVVWCVSSFAQEFDQGYWTDLGHTLLLGMLAAGLVCTAALVLSYAARLHPKGLVRYLVRTSTLGYALPGTVLAVGVVIPSAGVDNLLATMTDFLGLPLMPAIQGTVPVMLAAYMVRFMAVGFNPVDSAMHRVTRSIDETARTLGTRGLGLLRRVYVPILKSGILTAGVLVLVDVMKEMPITLMTRPFGMDTLAVKIFELTSEGEWHRAALPAVTLVLTGLIPVALLTRLSEITPARRKTDG
jgi:iron(III) transport system permease protein